MVPEHSVDRQLTLELDHPLPVLDVKNVQSKADWLGGRGYRSSAKETRKTIFT